MSENRRNAWRLTHEGVGWLAASGFRAACTVEDISVSGARVRVSGLKPAKLHALPEKLSLTVVVGGEQVSVPGYVTRLDLQTRGGPFVGIRFLNGDAANLGWLINQAQREEIRAAHHPA